MREELDRGDVTDSPTSFIPQEMMDVKRTLHQTNDKGLLINSLLLRRQKLQGITSTTRLFKVDGSA